MSVPEHIISDSSPAAPSGATSAFRVRPSVSNHGILRLSKRHNKRRQNMEKKRTSAIPTDLSDDAVVEISGELRKLLADVFALYVKTKNFHWHMSGPHFRAYHLLLDEHGSQIFAMTDDIAERARKIGGTKIRS